MKLLNKEQLQKLTTQRLLSYKDVLMQVPEKPDWGDSLFSKMSKAHPQWQETYAVVKEILKTREHVE